MTIFESIQKAVGPTPYHRVGRLRECEEPTGKEKSLKVT